MTTYTFRWLRIFAYAALLLLCLAALPRAHGQNVRYDGTVTNRNGMPVGGASIAVCSQGSPASPAPCVVPVPLCSSVTDTVCTSPNPVTSDSLGNYNFYLKAGTGLFTAQFYGSGLTTRLQPDQGAANSIALTGVFTNTQQNEYFTSVLNGLNIGAEYTLQQGGNFATDALTGAVACPASGTVHQCNGASGYVTNASTTTQGVGVFGNARSTASGASVLGANFVAAGTNGVGNAAMAAGEFDFNPANATDTGTTISGVYGGTVQSNNANDFLCKVQNPASVHFSSCFVASTGATAGGTASPAVTLQPIGSGVNKASQSIDLVSNDPAVGTHEGTLIETALGVFTLSNSNFSAPKLGSSGTGNGTSAPFTSIASGQVGYAWKDTSQAVDAKLWDAVVGIDANTLRFRALNDAENSALNWLVVTRTGVASATEAFTGTVSATAYGTATNCSGVGTAASPSVASCGSAAAGSFSCATNATGATCQVNTSAVTANSQIFVMEDETLGAKLGVTCNTGTTVIPTSRLLASRSAGVSFTINLGTVTTNPACFSYFIVN